MFERDIISQLAAWKTDTNRKPLVVHGARQVGKTWTLKYFGREYFDDVAYFSLDKDESGLCDVFRTTKDPQRIIQHLSFLHGKKIEPQTTLLILDEIQECNEALNALKYFCEEAPEYAVACVAWIIWYQMIGKNFEKNVHEFVWGRSGYETVDIDENAIKIDEDQIYEFKNIDRMFLYKNFFFFITNEKKIFIFKTTDMESDELIKIIKTTGILFEKKEKPFNIYKYCKKGKSF